MPWSWAIVSVCAGGVQAASENDGNADPLHCNVVTTSYGAGSAELAIESRSSTWTKSQLPECSGSAVTTRRLASATELHGKVIAALLHACVEDLHDVRVAHPRREPCLLHKQLHRPRVLHQVRQQQLERQRLLELPEPLLDREVDLSHAPRREPLAQHVPPESQVVSEPLTS